MTARSFALLSTLVACASARVEEGVVVTVPAPASAASASAAPPTRATEPSSDPDEPSTPRPEATAQMPPGVVRRFRVDSCAFGALALKHAKLSYLHSLKGAKPSPNRLPDLGVDPSSKRLAGRYAANVRHCATALTVKGTADPALDPVLEELSTFALPLAKVLDEAAQYFASEKYKDDAFAAGNQFHACLVSTGACEVKHHASQVAVSNAFALLDAKLAKLSVAVEAFRSKNPIDMSGYDEPQKQSSSTVDDANTLLLAFDTRPLDTKRVGAALLKLEASLGVMKGRCPPGATCDDWAKAMIPVVQNLVDHAKTLAPSASGTLDGWRMKKLVDAHARVVERNFTVFQRKLRAARPVP